MKIRYIAMAALLAATLGAQAKSPKRGVSENEFQFKAQMEALEPGVSWFYTWGNAMGRYLYNQDYMEFVPMCWNGGYNPDAIREYVQSHPETKYLLGFNEPNFTNQANMTPAEAAAKWPEVKALADELNLQLVAPALNTSPNPPYQDPTKWMDEFVALVGNDAFDYTAVHSYGGYNAMVNICTTFHERYGKDVWLTEFCLWPDEGNAGSSVAPSAQISSMVRSLEFLETTPWIFRYAWFKAIGNSDAKTGPNYGLLMSGKGEDPRELSEQGKVYVNMWDFDAERYYKVNETVPASNYIASTNLVVGSTNDAASGLPLEITNFTGNSSADYQYEIPADGYYRLALRVSGFGEPTRFDPSIDLYEVRADGTDGECYYSTGTFSLPNSDTNYRDVYLFANLKAGKQTLRLKDVGNPSGIRISTLTLQNATGVADVLGDSNADTTDVYSLQGVLLRSGVETATALEGLPAGIYICGGKKVIRK